MPKRNASASVTDTSTAATTGASPAGGAAASAAASPKSLINKATRAVKGRLAELPAPAQPSVLIDKATHLVKEHPVAAVAAAATAGAIAGVEIAAGILVGIGVTVLLEVKGGKDFRDQMLKRGKELFMETRERLAGARSGAETKAASAVQSPSAPSAGSA